MKSVHSDVMRTIGTLGRIGLVGALLGLIGCSDGVERGTVQVPARDSMKPGGAEGKPAPGKAAGKEKKNAPDTKVMVPGGKKA